METKAKTRTGIFIELWKWLRSLDIEDLIAILNLIKTIITMWKTQFNSTPTEGQAFKKPSQTIQGQTLSISEMLARINNGMPINQALASYEEGEEPLPIIKDLTDYDDIQSSVNQSVKKVAKNKQLRLKLEQEKALQENATT